MMDATAFIVRKQGAAFEQVQAKLDELRPGEVLVELKATGICHTDLSVARGKIPVQLPAILGHEGKSRVSSSQSHVEGLVDHFADWQVGAGVVLDFGDDVVGLQKGDHVVLSYNYCGSCRSCRAKRTWHCSDVMKANFGGCRPDRSSTITIAGESGVSSNFFGQSSFCNPTVVQAACCVKVDPKLPLSVVCALGCGFQTGAGAVYNVLKPNETKIRSLAVFGIGGVGCAAIMVAKYLSKQDDNELRTIIAVDVIEERLQLARDLGATHAINSAATTDVKAATDDLTNGEGVDAVIDCTAILAVIDTMIKCLGPGGVAVTVGGPPPGSQLSLDIFDFLIGAKTYRGCHQGNAYSKEVRHLTNQVTRIIDICIVHTLPGRPVLAGRNANRENAERVRSVGYQSCRSRHIYWSRGKSHPVVVLMLKSPFD
jgi:aryl-alcohol dehydrogenase